MGMLTFVLILLNIICVLVGVAFFTLFERKLLGYIQLRKGPNKTGLAGLFQPFADAIKLFSKEHVNPSLSNYVPFVVSGFNTEYRRGGFAMIMLAEYTSILFMSMLFVVIFIGGMTTFIGPFSFMSVAFLFV